MEENLKLSGEVIVFLLIDGKTFRHSVPNIAEFLKEIKNYYYIDGSFYPYHTIARIDIRVDDMPLKKKSLVQELILN